MNLARPAILVSALALALPVARGDDDLSRLSSELAAARQLEFKSPVKRVHLSLANAAKRMELIIDRENDAAALDGQAQLLAALGLVPEGYPLRQKLLALLAEQVAGFYDPLPKEFVIVDFPVDHPVAAMVAASRETVLVHELDHALNDQHFDLTEMLEGNAALKQHDDMLFARRALAEGDATLAMMLVMLRRSGMAADPKAFPLDELSKQVEAMGSVDTPELKEAPPFIKTQLITPYVLGLRYLGRLYQRGGWKAVNEAWRKPPISTEQMLHPEQKADPPQRIKAPTPPAGATIRAELELGELGIRLLLAPRLGAEKAEAAAAGWNGDRVTLLVGEDGRRLLRIDSAWDSAADAREFHAALKEWCGCDAGPAPRGERVTLELKR